MIDRRDVLEEQIHRWIQPALQKLNAYPVPDASGLVKLDAMENPFAFPEDLHQAWFQRLAEQARINRYPHPEAPALKSALRAVMNIDERWDILLGNGSDELIQMIAMAVKGPGRKLLAPEPSFVLYGMVATFLGLDYVGVPLTRDFELDLEAMLLKIEREQPAVIFLAQPNNPTGNLWGDEKLRRIIEAAPGLVVIDEAYTAFTHADYSSWLDDYPNLLVMRTLSKVGLAGLRLGILVGDAAWCEQINKVRLPYNINSLTQVTASFALDHFSVFEQQTRELVNQRERLIASLRQLPGLSVYDSQANFVLVRTESDEAARIHQELIEAGVLIKKLDGSHPLLADCLRITVSNETENSQCLAALQKVLPGA
ncbi:MAG: histidinol-phosphate transaminase [Saccharospirillum sp.]|nr:histidinol-phosphate transaminase [Saccharospirillum sp.]